MTNTSFAGNDENTSVTMYDAMYREYEILGRWPSPDPAGMAAANPANPQSWNRYAYVTNNPLVSTDPLGLGSMGCLAAGRQGGILLPRCVDTPFGGGSGDDGVGIDGGIGPASLCTDAGCVQCPNNDCGFGSPGGEYQCDAAGTCGYYNSSPGTDPDLSAAVSNCVSSQYGVTHLVWP